MCQVILESEQSEKYKNAYEIATERFDKTGGELMMNSDKFYYADIMANLCDKMNRKDEASEFAVSALELSKINEPQFNRHKNVGLVQAKSEQLNRLERLNYSALQVQRFIDTGLKVPLYYSNIKLELSLQSRR